MAIRKIINIGSQVSLAVESGLVFIPAVIYLLLLKGENYLFSGVSPIKYYLLAVA